VLFEDELLEEEMKDFGIARIGNVSTLQV